MQKGSFISSQLRSGEVLLQNRRTDFSGTNEAGQTGIV